MKKMKFIILMIVLFLFGTGCGTKVEFYETIDEQDLIVKAKELIWEEYKEEVTAEIISKEDLMGCGLWLDFGCANNIKVDGAYSYIVKVTSIENPEFYGTVMYSDPYLVDGALVRAQISSYGYNYSKTSYNNKLIIDNILSNYKNIKYKINNEYFEQFVYIYSNNKNELLDIFDKLEKVIDGYKLMIYVIEELDYFNTIDKNVRKITGDVIDSSYKIDLNLEKDIDDSEYSYYIYNITNDSCLINKYPLCSKLIGIK